MSAATPPLLTPPHSAAASPDAVVHLLDALLGHLHAERHPDALVQAALAALAMAAGSPRAFLLLRRAGLQGQPTCQTLLWPAGAAVGPAADWPAWLEALQALPPLANRAREDGPSRDGRPPVWLLGAAHTAAWPRVQQVLPGAVQVWLLPLQQGGEWIGLAGLEVTSPTPAAPPSVLPPPLQTLVPAAAAVVGSAVLRSQRNEALGSLRESEQGYRAVFEMAAVGIALTGTDGRLIDVNPRYCEILGRSAEELKGQHVADLTHPEDVAQDLTLIQATLDGQLPGSRFSREKRYRRADGSVVWVNLRAVLVRDAHGRPDHFVTTVEDVTERKRYQDAMIAAQAAERATRAKSEFLSRMSHELRTPLNAMLGFAQLLRVDASQPLSSAQRQKIEHIERAGAHLLAMINDVLDLSRIESGMVPMSVETVRVASVVEDALHLIATAAREADVRLLHQPPREELYVRADRVRLRQILTNLLSNAVKYNYRGGHVSVVIAREQRRDGPCVSVAVTDTGPGLTAEQLNRLFEPFNRLGAERSGVEGTGIGLVITRRLLDLMQGAIEVDSQPGRGSTFAVRLPLTEAPALGLAPDLLREPGARYVAGRSAPSPAPEGDGEDFLTSPGELDGHDPLPSAARPFTVLYAEDNQVNVELVRQVMRMRPAYRLLVGHSGAQAIELARSLRPDVLLLDMHLGDMTGLDVVHVLERDAGTAGIPRIALSADALPDQIRAAREHGFRLYLTKPLDVGALLRALDEHAQALTQADAAGPG